MKPALALKRVPLSLGLVLLVFSFCLACDVVGDDPSESSGQADDDADEEGNCPAGFEYFPGGDFLIFREGDRWPGGFFEYEIFLEPFCLARYECSQPTAGPDDRGAFPADPDFGREDLPPAQVQADVLPWNNLGWFQALLAVHQQGWRLPTYEELQVAATGGDEEKMWIFGYDWDCEAAERSWYENCQGESQRSSPGPTGGPFGDSDYGMGVFDMLGNVTEWTSTPWDYDCYGATRFSLFGGGFGGHSWSFNTQVPDLDNPGCFLMETFGGHARGEHEHPWDYLAPSDDGFRAAADPGPQWEDWQPNTEPGQIDFPIEVWFYSAEAGEKQYLSIDPPEAPGVP